MEWNMLNESKKLFPHWLDKNENSNFSKHLKILNNQQRDIRHKIKTIDWGRLLNKPLQIHKTQTEPYKWKVEFEVNIPRLKQINIYKNPTIVNNHVINNSNVINGYYFENVFYKNHSTEVTNLLNKEFSEENEDSKINVIDKYSDIIELENEKYYFDLINNDYYKFEDNTLKNVEEEEVSQTSLIHSETFIDNYSHFFKHIIYEDNEGSVKINKFIINENNEQEYKSIVNYSQNSNLDNNGKYELTYLEEDVPKICYNITNEKYFVFENDEYVECEDVNLNNYIVTYTVNESVDEYDNEINEYTYYNDGNEIDVNSVSRIPLIETVDISPIISDDKYVIEVYTWDDYHFLKGFPEIDFIDYNQNNIIDENEKNYDNLNIEIEEINGKEYLTFRVHQFGIKLVEIFKDEKPIHSADFLIEKLNFKDGQINSNFAHIYNYNDNEVYYLSKKDTDSLEEVNLDIDEYVWRLELSDDDKIYDENGAFELKNNYDLKVTYYDSLHPYDTDYDSTITKRYVCEESIFYHDISLDKIGALYNVPRHVFRQNPSFESFDEEIDYYSKTYPSFSNSLNEDDYHYQKRLEYYINNYNKIYFPCLELWKYFNIDSELINRKVIVAEQNYSYMRTLDAEEDNYINELSKNKLDSFYTYYKDDVLKEKANVQKPKLKSIIRSDEKSNSINGILIDENNNYIKDIYGNLVRIEYDYDIYIIKNNEKYLIHYDEYGRKYYVDKYDDYKKKYTIDLYEKEYVIKYEEDSKEFQWYNAELIENEYQLKLTELLKVVPNTNYRLRFCVKGEYDNQLLLKIIYKNNEGDVREVEEKVLEIQDYDDINEYNELIYTDYNKEWNIDCEYVYLDFLTLPSAQNIELCLESESQFQISDITLQRVTINHFDSEYMKTDTDYNSCVYDLYADYTEIPSNIKYDDWTIFNKILNRSLPLTKKGFFNFMFKSTDVSNDMDLTGETRIYLSNMLDVEKENSLAKDYYTNITEHTYEFNKYVKEGEYEIILKPYFDIENNIISDFKINVEMLVFDEKNIASYNLLEFSNCDEFLVYEGEDKYFKIPFMNESNNLMKIKIYRDDTFSFKNFKLVRKSPLTMEEIL